MIFFICALVSLSAVNAVNDDNTVISNTTSVHSQDITPDNVENSKIESNCIEKNMISSNDNTSDKIITDTDTNTRVEQQSISKNNKENKTSNTLLTTSISIDNITYAKKGATTNINAVIVDSNNNPVTRGDVVVKINGLTINKLTLNGSNKISINYDSSALRAKLYNITIKYGRNSQYDQTISESKLRIVSKVTSYTHSEILDAANRTTNYIRKYDVLPNYVTIATDHVLMNDFLYMLLCSINSTARVYNGEFSSYVSLSTTNCDGQRIYQSEYMNLADSIKQCYIVNGRQPQNFVSSVGNLSFDDVLYFYSRVVSYEYEHGAYSYFGTVIKLNNTNDYYHNTKQKINIDLTSYKVYANTKAQITANLTYGDGTAVDNVLVAFKINGLSIGSAKASEGVATINFTVPNWGAKDYTLVAKVGESGSNYATNKTSKFTVLSDQTTNNTTTTTRNTKINVDSIIFGKINNTVKLVATITDTKGVGVNTGKVAFKVNQKTVGVVDVSNSKATLSYYPSGLTAKMYNLSVVYSGDTGYNASRTESKLKILTHLSVYNYSEILDGANRTKVFIETYNALPNYVTLNGDHVSMCDFLYLLTQAINKSSAYVDGEFSHTQSTSKTNCYDQKITKDNYMALANTIAKYYAENGKQPATFKSNVGNMSFEDTVYFYTRAVAFIYNNDIMPAYGTVLDYSGGSNDGSSDISSLVGNNTYSSDYEKYLDKTANCQVNDSAIKSAVKKAINGVSGSYNQAKAIFDYVNDLTSYSYYYNTRNGALKTLSLKYGNCVDMSHLVIAMFRTAGLPARYVHGQNCRFRSGLVVGHVWAEVYVNGKWYSCDATSNSNSFGKIVNWSSCTSTTRYISLPF
ncbi:MAG: hypothetical protein BZ136_06795 [Methanosphaera sp. rholeuAM74]|nr:MAG: hypothetical protein BZ136_06795 [Methanosphaera sp. rholeuAM74]